MKDVMEGVTEGVSEGLSPPAQGDDWVLLTAEPLPVDAALAWAVRPHCGGVVAFVGTVRDHAEGRPGVTALEYEAYADEAERRLALVGADTRHRWPRLGRLAMLHRTGRLGLTEVAVVVVASAPHRDDAFAAARHAIDTLKATVPIWKREWWQGGVGWGTCSHEVTEVAR